MFEILEADILIMQEAKIQRKDIQDDMVMIPGWDVYFSLPKHKKGMDSNTCCNCQANYFQGYSGVAIYTRNSSCAPIRAEEGITGVLCPPKSTTSFRDLPEDQRIGGYPRPGQLSGLVEDTVLDSEGRCVMLEFPAFVLLGVYSPANRDESRDEFRMSFLEALDVRIRNLVAMGKQVILTGDLNVVGSPIDTSNLEEVLRKTGWTLEEWADTSSRRIFNQLIHNGSIKEPRDEGRESPVLWDLTRLFHPDRQKMNTCWDTLRNTRPANLGSRIDYVLCSDGIKPWFTFSNIQEGLMGSDHCPVYATIDDVVTQDGQQLPVQELMNPVTLFTDGARVRGWTLKDALPLSAKLMPEFDGRRSIKDMFSKKPVWTPKFQATPPELPQPREPIVAATASQDNSSTPLEPRSGIKREGSLSFTGAPKRAKPATDNSQAKSKTKPGQKTLQGFFKPKSAPASAPPLSPAPSASTIGDVGANFTSASPLPPPQPPAAAHPSKNLQSLEDAETVFDPIENKESWSKLLGKRVVPRCEHNEPCISLLTKKPGVNCGKANWYHTYFSLAIANILDSAGRSFYICPRPLGPSGEKEKGTEWRCGTFIWSSDWTGTAGG